tara:strand:- start:11 stop:196 length:186 start_codon:yes stop_codon:yes gene_type:complete
MSIRRTYVGPLKDIKNYYEKAGKKEFIKRYEKVEVFIGPGESIDFINDILEEHFKTVSKSV